MSEKHYKITHFWQWFTHNEAIFRDESKAPQAKEMLDNQILSFGRFAWGIDEGHQKSFVFTISPNNDAKLLAISKQIIQAAPNLAMWEFRYCKAPDLSWDFTFQTFNNLMVLQTFDASEWAFLLAEESDYKVRIEIKAENMDSLDLDDQEIAASRAVTNILGEALRIEEISSVKMVYQFDPKDVEWVYSMRELRERFLFFIE